MRKNPFRSNRRGFTFVECIVAVALFAVIGTLGISLFSNSTRYMSEAKREQARLSEASFKAQTDDFKFPVKSCVNAARAASANGTAGCPIIFPKSVLRIERDNTGTGGAASDHVYLYAELAYETEYGDMKVTIPVREVEEIDPRAVAITGRNYKCYEVLSDGYVMMAGKAVPAGREIYIYKDSEGYGCYVPQTAS